MKILLLGGTGAMGVYVKEFLKKREYELIITSRQARNSENNVQYIQEDAKKIDSITRICKQHWDAIVDFMVYSTKELQERIDLLLDSTDQYVFISSARVYADSQERITEDSPRLLDTCTDMEYLATDEYALAKAREDNIFFNNSKRNWTIVRPSLTYSEERLQLGVYEKENWLYRALNGRSIVFSKDLMNKYYTLTYGRNVAEGIAAIVGQKDAIGEVFHIVQEQSFQWKDIMEIYLNEIERKTGKRPNVVLTDMCTNIELPSAKYQVIYGRYFNRFFDNSKIRQFVDTEKWITPEVGLRMCIDAFLDNPHFLDIDWTKEVLIDKAAHEWTRLQEIPGKKAKFRYLKHRLL